jgi:hypothetical protein
MGSAGIARSIVASTPPQGSSRHLSSKAPTTDMTTGFNEIGTLLTRSAEYIAKRLERVEEKSKILFVVTALGLYAWSLVELSRDVDILTDVNTYLVRALANLAIPFGVLLMQELLELITNISHSTLQSARRQFEIVVLVVVRSFFKSFDKLNGYVDDGSLGAPIYQAGLKILAILVMSALIIYFVSNTTKASISDYLVGGRTANLFKQMLVLILVALILVGEIRNGFENIHFISTVFTAMIVADAVFLVIAIMRDSEFDKIIFESSLVIALIFVRFPLFTSNEISYGLSIVGMLFASLSLYLFVRSREMQKAFADRVQTSYELRESMTALKGYSEMVLEDLEDLDTAEIRPDLERIYEAGEKLLPLIDDILDLSKSDHDPVPEIYPNDVNRSGG